LEERTEKKLRDLKKYNYFVILPDDQMKLNWDLLITLLLFFVFFVTPYRIAFPNETESMWWIIVDQGVDFIFVIDIFLTFFSAFYNHKFILIDKRPAIAWNYMKTWLIIDVVAVIPINLFLASADFAALVRLSKVGRLYKLVKMFRLVRIMRILKEKNKVVKSLNDILKISVAFERLVFFCLVFFLLVHIVTCFWIIIGNLDESTENWIYANGF